MFGSISAWLCLLSPELIAQAGGGGNFGGGGSSSGGGSGGGGGGGDGFGVLIHLLIRFTIQYPQYGVPLCIVIAIGFYQAQKTGNDYRITRTIRKGRKFQEDNLRNSAIG